MPTVKEIVAGVAVLSVVMLPWYVMIASPRPALADVIATAVVSLLVLLFSATKTTGKGSTGATRTEDKE